MNKYKGIYPAFYACYDDDGAISPARTAGYARFLADAGVDGLYVGGSSGECIYRSVPDRKAELAAVMEAVGGRVRVIAHVACGNTADSAELASYAQSIGADAVAAIPPIYFKLPEHAIAAYWNAISAAAPQTDFFIYNIPQLAGTSLTPSLLGEMLKNPKVVGVKNSSPSCEDIVRELIAGGDGFCVFSGVDEQLCAGLAAGACGGIGGTYGVMPDLYVRLYQLCREGRNEEAAALQRKLTGIIYGMTGAHGHMLSMAKEMLRLRGLELGTARLPLAPLSAEDRLIARRLNEKIDMLRGEI
ncbi:MAG: dihydrodipicolinate synthase family protein [Clostridia bacterium]|nr:dihydrodipicolinate synthase family protein [Clostridia bacterium]